VWITTRKQSQEIDRRAIEEFGIPSTDLMEAAGQVIVDLAITLIPEKAKVAILCGPGNNGGDGLVVARLLQKLGHKITLLITSSEEKLSPLAKEQLKKARYLKLEPIFPPNPKFQAELQNLTTQNLIIDALLGTGSQGAPRDHIAQVIQYANNSKTAILSIDIPSGIDCDTGDGHDPHIRATHTITIGNPKPFLFQSSGLEASGNWTVAPINFPFELLNQPTDAEYINHFKLLKPRVKNSHKGTSGRLLIVAGSDSMPGAAILTAHAALRSGIGLVTLASTPEVCRAASHHFPEILLLPLPTQNGVIAPEATQILLEKQSQFDASIFGPGLTTQDEIISLLNNLFPNWQTKSVIDADALHALRKEIPLPKTQCILTPHPGELSRHLFVSANKINHQRFISAKAGQELYKSILLLKGPNSIVASNDSPLAINSTGNPGMATGGMGDALSGIIGTLLAQGYSPRDSAIAGMFWHGLAADRCAQEIGSAGYTATDLIRNLPCTRAKLTLS
jgi:ADP-dependent NAD(P)H-hydrate dehydratase / NAD(P)H-hydrate epimerase